MEHFLSPKDLAAAIAVSESSLKRWTDEGLISATRTAGGHRRIALAEAIRFIRKAGITVVKPELLGIPGLSKRPAASPAEADDLLIKALQEGREQEAATLVISGYLAGRGVAELCDGPLAGAMHAVGDLWRHGPEGIVIEHRAVQICMRALHQLRSLLPPPPADAALALGGAPEGDPYVLPSLMVSMVLAAAGWKTVNLGADLPARALLAAAEAHHPELVWLSCSVEQVGRQRDREIRKTCETLVSAGTRVVIGGRAWDARRPELADGVSYVTSMGAIAAFVEGLATPAKSTR